MATVLTARLLTSTISTPIGSLTVVAGNDRVLAAGFTDDLQAVVGTLGKHRDVSEVETVGDLGRITERLTAYFAGDLAALDAIPVAPRGSLFQQRVWEALRAVPPGQPTTYRDLAIQLGGPQLARAVGTANAANPIAPIVPCHRLVGTDGRLRGYYWSLDRKRWLLAHEARHAGLAFTRGSEA